jgi:Ras-related protein Rab-8A
VYDVTDRGSFQSIKTWVDEIERNADKHVNKVLIANKADVDDNLRAVSKGEGETLARDYNMSFFETSAKRGTGVSEAFQNIAKQVVDRLSKEGGGAGAGRAGAGAGAAKVDIKGKDAGKAGGGGCCK